MRKKRLVILVIILGGFTTWLTLRHKISGTSDKSKTEFAVAETDKINKIFLSNKLDGHVILEKENGIWKVNHKYPVYKGTMDFFLNETIKKIRVRGPVPKPSRLNVISSMAATATKVEIYIDNELEKVYYVGQPTNDMSGTYMYLEGSKDPYITHIPGFDGFLTPRFPVIESEWASKVVFDYKPEEIHAVDVDFPAMPQASFTVSRRANPGDFDISANSSAPNGTINYSAVKSYFGLFENKTCEGYVDLDKGYLDSMLKSTPYCIITLTGANKKVQKVRVYQRKSSERDHALFDKKGNRLTYDPSRFNAVIEGDKRVAVIQDIVFGPIMVSYSDFFVKTASD
jgi:hypothetical protein